MSETIRRRSTRIQNKVVELITIDSSSEGLDDDDIQIIGSDSEPEEIREIQPSTPRPDNEDAICRKKIHDRKLKLKKIIGAVKDKEVLFIVKWDGIDELEKIPLRVLRKYFCQDLLDFFFENLKWVSKTS